MNPINPLVPMFPGQPASAQKSIKTFAEMAFAPFQFIRFRSQDGIGRRIGTGGLASN